MIEKIKKYIVAGISMLFGAFLPYLYSYADAYAQNAQMVIYALSIVLFLVGFLMVILFQYQERCHRVKYSVLIFCLDAQNRLLTVYNTYHHRTMIPCGVIPAHLTPNETVKLFLEKQAGIKEGSYHNFICSEKRYVDEGRLCPNDAQIEFVTKHERHVKLHYAFIYFVQVAEEVKLLPSASFLNLAELERMPLEKGLYSDLLNRYRIFLQDINKENSNDR